MQNVCTILHTCCVRLSGDDKNGTFNTIIIAYLIVVIIAQRIESYGECSLIVHRWDCKQTSPIQQQIIANNRSIK